VEIFIEFIFLKCSMEILIQTILSKRNTKMKYPIILILTLICNPLMASTSQYHLEYYTQSQGGGQLTANQYMHRTVLIGQPILQTQAEAGRFMGRFNTGYLLLAQMNNSPVITGDQLIYIDAINEDSFLNNGTAIEDLLASDNKISDIDQNAKTGIALMNVINTNGYWQFSTDYGKRWHAIENISDTNAILLYADGETTRLRFLPHLDYFGDQTGQITFCAWDRSSDIENGTTGHVIDTRGGTTSFSENDAHISIRVMPTNDAPVAFDITEICDEDQTLISKLSYADKDSESVTFQIVEPPQLGTISLTDLETGDYVYTPDTDKNGLDSFSYRVNDGDQDSNISQVEIRINPANDRPIANDGKIVTDQGYDKTGILRATDIDHDSLTYSIFSPPEKGALTIIYPKTGAFIYSPDPNESGADQFSFIANDGSKDSNIAEISIIINPVYYVITDDPPPEDNAPPVLALLGNTNDEIIAGQNYTDPGATAYDNEDGDLTDQILVTGQINNALLGEYLLYYNVRDSVGHYAEQLVRKVTVINGKGTLKGTVEYVSSDLIQHPDQEIQVTLKYPTTLKPVPVTVADTKKDAKSVNPQWIQPDQTFEFPDLYWQTYLLEITVKDTTEPEDYVMFIKREKISVNEENVVKTLSIPKLTPIAQSYGLHVKIDSGPQEYQYTLIDATTGKTVREVLSGSDRSFTAHLEPGNYRLLLQGKGYLPYEYQDTSNDKTIITLDTNKTVSVSMIQASHYNPDSPQLDISHSNTNTGFQCKIVQTNFTENNSLNINIINGQTKRSQRLNQSRYSGAGTILDPLIYEWTPDDAWTHMRYETPEKGDITYDVVFQFYLDDQPFRSYTITYVDYATLESKHANKSSDQKAFEASFEETITAETRSSFEFYPLAGAMFNVAMKDTLGSDKNIEIKIPPIPLDYLYIDDANESEGGSLDYNSETDYYQIDAKGSAQYKLSPEDLLIANIALYAFGDKAAGSGANLYFTQKDTGNIVRYNPLHSSDHSGRSKNAPVIALPLLINPKSKLFKDIQGLSALGESLSILTNERGDGSFGFSEAQLPFIVQNDGLVLIDMHHLTSVGMTLKKTSTAADTTDGSDCGSDGCDCSRPSSCFIGVLYQMINNQ